MLSQSPTFLPNGNRLKKGPRQHFTGYRMKKFHFSSDRKIFSMFTYRSPFPSKLGRSGVLCREGLKYLPPSLAILPLPPTGRRLEKGALPTHTGQTKKYFVDIFHKWYRIKKEGLLDCCIQASCQIHLSVRLKLSIVQSLLYSGISAYFFGL